MNADIARQVARDPIPHSRAVLALALGVLLQDLERAESHLAEANRQRTLGGVPRASTTEWANQRAETPALHPDYVELAEKTP